MPLLRSVKECALFLRNLNFFRSSYGAGFRWKWVWWGELQQNPQVKLSRFSSLKEDLFLWSRMNGVYHSAQLPNRA